MTLDLEKIDLGSFGVNQEDRKQDQLGATVSEALKVNPDQHAHTMKLSKDSGVPDFAVESNPDEVEHKLKLDQIDIESFSARAPRAADFIGRDFNTAVIAQEDITAGVLESIEGALTSVTDVGRSVPAGFLGGFGSAFTGLARTLEVGARSTARGLDAILPESFDRFLYDQDDTPEALKIAQDITPQVFLRLGGEGLKAASRDIGAPEERQNIATDIAGAVGQIGQQIATYFINPAAAVTTMFAQGVDQQGERQAATGTEGEDLQSDVALLAGGAVTAVSEKLGLDAILNRIPPKIKNDVLRQITDVAMAGGIEAVQEVVENVAQGVLELYTTNPDAEIFEGIEREAIAAGGAGAIVRGIINSITPGRVRSVQDAESYNQSVSEIEQGRIDALSESADKSKLKERDVETFKQFVREADGDNNTHVFIDSAQTALYLQSKTRDEIEADPALKSLDNALRESRATGADISVAVDEFAGEITGTEHFAELREHMTLNENSVSPFRQEQHQQETQDYVRSLLDEANENVSEYVEAQEIYASIRDQLIDTGAVSAQNASVMAQVVPAWATAQARRSGRTVAQVYADAGLTIQGPQTGELARLESEQVLTQAREAGFEGDDTGEALEWTRAAEKGLDMSQEARMERAREMGFDTGRVLYHGTENLPQRFKVGVPSKRYTTFSEREVESQGVFFADNREDAAEYGSDVGEFFIKSSNVLTPPGEMVESSRDFVGIAKADKALKDIEYALQPVIDDGHIDIDGGVSRMPVDTDGDWLYKTTDGGFEWIHLDNPEVVRRLKERGYDAVEVHEPDGINSDRSLMVLDPSNIRSVNAAFDPEFKESPDLLAQEAVEGPQTGELSRLESEALLRQDVELSVTEASDFVTALADARSKHERGLSVAEFDQSEYEVMDTYLLDEGKAGFAIESDGTLTGVFKSPDSSIEDAMSVIVPAAIRAGATQLDAFEGFLTESYEKFGFVEKHRVRWSDEFAPEGWDKERFGTPDVVYMELSDDARESVLRRADAQSVQEARGLRRSGEGVQQDRDRGRGDVGRTETPLAGAPIIDGATGPDPSIVAVAQQYAADNGIGLLRQSEYAQVDEDRAARIADAYEQMQHAPNDPEVKAAYDDLIAQTRAQYDALVDAGYEFYFFDETNDPYNGNPWNAMRELRADKRMGVFSTVAGFGSEVTGADVSDNPLLQDTGLTWEYQGQQKPVLANDLFRAVHDAFGHGMEGAGFRADGEENAWQAHIRLFTGAAVGAITTETRGQNSWLNFGPHGESNRTAAVEDTVFADQKTGLMPEWTWTEGRVEDQPVTPSSDEIFPQQVPAISEPRGYYDPANSVIRLTEAADLSTFLHEFAHFMYEMEVNGNTEMLQSINGWYKRNADDVAKEANAYLGEKFDALKQGAVEVRQGETFRMLGREWDVSKGYEVAQSESVNSESVAVSDLATMLGFVRLDPNQVEKADLSKPVLVAEVNGGLVMIDGYHRVARARSEGVTEIQAIILNDVQSKSIENDQFAQSELPEAKVGSITAEAVVAYLDEGTTGDKDQDAAIRRAVHEQFARGFETYLMEGKAPSIELRNAFRTFARWLAQIYQSMRGQLNVNLDDQMRQVFDRLLATEEQLAAAEARARVEPLFTDATMAGMNETEFAEYKKRQAKVKDVQSETLRDKLIAQLTRQTKTWWNEEKQDLIDEETQKLRSERVYAAAARLKDGDIKLDHATVKDLAGEERTDKLGRKSTRVPDELRGMTAKGQAGVHPDEAAAFFGYDSGDQLLTDLITAPKIKDVAAANAEQRMIERHGDILTDGTIEQLADEAIQNEERGRLLLSELKILTRGTSQRTLERQAIKAIAKERIGQLSFREIHPGKYRKAEIRAAQESARMLAEGNREGAAQAKQRQVVNYYMGLEATEAKNSITNIVDRMARYNKKKVREEIQKAEGGYWDQIVKILERFEFRKSASLSQVDQVNQSINTWVKERMDTDGDALVIHNAVLNESYVTHWKNVAYSDMQGISDSVKNIEHVARYANKLTRMGEEIEFNKLVDRWTASMDEKVETRFSSQRTDVVEGRNWGRQLMSQMSKIPWMASWLDGGERTGISHQVMVQPFTDAYAAEIELWKQSAAPVMEAIENRSKEDRKRHNRKFFIPEINDHLYGNQIIAVALNTGNESNLRKLLLGEGWANPDDDADINIGNPKLQAVLKHMTASDWQMVQLIWDQMETLYPKLAEVHRRTTGLTPPKVEATPVETPFGTFNGGYYPVKYDPNRSHRAAENEDRMNAETESMFSNNASIQASVNAGATNERTGFYDAIRLSLDVVPAHFQETIHYITHHDPVREVNRLVRNPKVAKTIKEKLGPEEYAQLRPWLNDIAKDGRETPSKMFWDSILQRLRFGVTLGAMGFKASTGIIQVSGLSNTIAEVGMSNVLQGVRTVLGSTTTMREAWDFASSNSKVMSHRTKTMDREIKNAMARLEGKRGVLAAAQEASMKHIALIQTYMVDLPSWHAAYSKGIKEWGDEKRAFQYADFVIEQVQGSGATKDLARIMRNQAETGRMFTMFMTFFSSLWNMERDLVKGAKTGVYSTSTVAAKIMFLFTVPVLFEMLLRGEFSSDDDDDETITQKVLTNAALYPIQSVPFIRDIANASTGEFGYNISPMQQVLEQGIRTIPEVVERGFTDEEVTKGQIKGATKFIGAAVGVPGTGQAWATGEHLYEVLTEGEDLTLREFLFGPNR